MNVNGHFSTDKEVDYALVEAVKRKKKGTIESLDVLYGLTKIESEDNILPQFGVYEYLIEEIKPSKGVKLDFFDLLKRASKISATYESNLININHVLISLISKPTCKASSFISECLGEETLADMEAAAVDKLGFPGFVKSYLPPKSFWKYHWNSLIDSHPLLNREWHVGPNEEAAIFAHTDEPPIGAVVKQSEDDDVTIDYQYFGGKECIIVRSKPVGVDMAKNMIANYLVSRLRFKK